MSELPLYFLSSNSEQHHYIMCKKSAALTKTESIESLNFRHFRDWQITLRASDPRFYRNNGKITSTLINSEPQLNPAYTFEGPADPSAYQISLTGFSSAISTDWNGEKTSGTKSILFEQTSSASESYFSLDKNIESVAPSLFFSGEAVDFTGDVNVSIKNSSGVDIVNPEEYSLDYLFSLSFYSGNNLIKELKEEKNVSTGILSFQLSSQIPVGANKIKISVKFFNPGGTLQNLTTKVYLDNIALRKSNIYEDYISCINLGNYSSYPVIYLTGEFSNIELINDNSPAPFNNIKFKPSVEIVEGETYIIDTKEKTITDAVGNNKIASLDPSSGWLRLAPGENKLYFSDQTAIGTNAGVQISVQWKDAWV